MFPQNNSAYKGLITPFSRMILCFNSLRPTQAKIIDNSHLQFSSNSHAIIDEIFRNAPAILTYNSHPILTRQFSSNSHLQFSSNSHLQFSSNSHLTILIQFSPDNSHPIFTWQFSSNSHLQFSLNSHQHCSVNSHQQCSANFLVMISQSVLISHAAIFIQCWFYNGSE